MVDQPQSLQSVKPDVELPAELPGIVAVISDRSPNLGKTAHMEILPKTSMNVCRLGKNRFAIPIRTGFDRVEPITKDDEDPGIV